MNPFQLFLIHPRSVCMTYMNHLRFSGYLSVILAIASVRAAIHAVFPFWFEKSTTETIHYLLTLLQDSGCHKD
jgi:hypothetical protein